MGRDMAPLFKGLPDDCCQARYWGYVLTGTQKVKYSDGRIETFSAGQAYYIEPGHIPFFDEAYESVEFTPEDELKTTMDVVQKNIQAAAEKS